MRFLFVLFMAKLYHIRLAGSIHLCSENVQIPTFCNIFILALSYGKVDTRYRDEAMGTEI